MKPEWQVRPLGEVCEVIAGQSPDGSAYNDRGDGLPFYQGKKEFTDKYISAPTTWTTAVTKIAEAGDILMSVRAPVGPINLATERACIGRGLAAIRPGHGLELGFLWYALLWMQPQIIGSEGAVFPSINRGQIAALPIPLPPLDEQRRIVAVLDDAFEGLSRARANTEANLADARELLANGINDLMDSAIGSRSATLGDLCAFENGDRGKNYPGRKAFVASGVPFINAGHLRNGDIDWDEMNYIPPEHFARLSNGKTRKGDILFCLRGSLGKFGVVDTDLPGAIASSLVIVRPNPSLNPDFLAIYFKSQRCKDMIRAFENGAAQPNLSARNLAAFSILLPSLAEQDLIVSKVQEIETETEALVNYYEAQISDLDTLRQSLLQKAFAGELTV